MAKNADRPWVRQYVRQALSPVEEQADRTEFDLRALEERVMILENQVHDLMNPGGPVDPPEPPPLGEDELPVGGWGVITNLEDRDVQSFPITRTIHGASFLPHPSWYYSEPIADWPIVDDAEGNAWVICEYAGKWYMSTYEWLRYKQSLKPGVTRDNIADHTKKWQLQGWIPKTGDTLYFFCTTHVRNGTTNPQPQRSSVKRVVLA